MRGIFERLFAPSMEPTHDPRVLEMAARESERRIVRQELERAARMAEYAEKWPGLQAEAAPVERAPVLVWTREAAL
jgi:hypothetical protein